MTVYNFTRGIDKIDLRDIDASTRIAGNQSFNFIGDADFRGANLGAELRYEQSGHNLIVSGDVNGDGAADFEIQLQSLNALSASDFFL